MTTLTRYLSTLETDDARLEEPAATRQRLRDCFPPGATRRMTQLGLLVGSTLLKLDPDEADAIVYASGYAETRALEAYLDSFPSASPTLFQTSIHPSAVQQAMIGRQQSVRTFLPITGSRHLVAQALTAALLDRARRVLVTGGEERGSWLLDRQVASDRSFGFALALTTVPVGALAKVSLEPAGPDGEDQAMMLADFFDRLSARQPLAIGSPAGGRISVSWL